MSARISDKIAQLLVRGLYFHQVVKIVLIDFTAGLQSMQRGAKGQLISKGHFGFFNSPKKRTKNFCPSRLGQKFEFSSSFFGRNGDNKKTF